MVMYMVKLNTEVMEMLAKMTSEEIVELRFQANYINKTRECDRKIRFNGYKLEQAETVVAQIGEMDLSNLEDKTPQELMQLSKNLKALSNKGTYEARLEKNMEKKQRLENSKVEREERQLRKENERAERKVMAKLRMGY